MPSKTVRILLSAVTALCTLCGCAEKADSLALTVSKENIEQRTEEIAGYLLNNDMDSVSKYLSDDAVKKELNTAADTLKKSSGSLDHVLAVQDDIRNAGYAYFNSDNGVYRVYMQYDENMYISASSYSVQTQVTVENGNAYTQSIIAIGPSPQTDGVLTLPNSTSNPPVAILVPDSSEDTEKEYAFLAELAIGLAKQGVASIRLPLRYEVYPELAMDPYAVTLEEEYTHDIAYAIHIAETEAVNASEIYYIGHRKSALLSLGMTKNHFELHGAVVLAGSYRGYEEILLSGKENELKAQNLSDAEMDSELSAMKQAVAKIQTLDTEDTDELLLGYSADYWKQMNAYKAEKYINILSVPVLILFPEEDAEYSYETDYLPEKEMVKKKSLIRTESYKGLDHDFREADEDAISKDMINDLAEWILE